jgi:hypothetical protein
LSQPVEEATSSDLFSSFLPFSHQKHLHLLVLTNKTDYEMHRVWWLDPEEIVIKSRHYRVPRITVEAATGDPSPWMQGLGKARELMGEGMDYHQAMTIGGQGTVRLESAVVANQVRRKGRATPKGSRQSV